MNKVLIAVLGIALFSSYVRGQQPSAPTQSDGPTLSETLDLLKNKINSNAKGGYDSSIYTGNASSLDWTTTAEEFSGCQVRWVYTSTFRSREPKADLETTKTYRATIPLYEVFTSHAVQAKGESYWSVFLGHVDLSSGKIKFEAHEETWATNRETGETKLLSSEDHVTRSSITNIDFGIPGEDNQEIATRVAKAFKHAIDLCQSQKPKNDEPF